MNSEVNKTNDTELIARMSRLESYVSGVTSDKEIDLRILGTVLWQSKLLIASLTCMFAIASVIFALWLPNQYRATAILTPASSSSSGSPTLNRLAGLVGVIGGEGRIDKSLAAMELVKTWGFLESFIQENHIEVEVFAAKGWDRASGELIVDPNLYDTASGTWVRDFSPATGEAAVPSSWELYEVLEDSITVSQDRVTGLISLSVEHYSPILAKEWVDKLVSGINTFLQVLDRDEARKSIGYLQERIDQTSLTEMRAVFYRLIEEQTKNLMLSEVSDEYVLKTLSSAKVPEEKSRPNRAIICILGTLSGALLAVLVVITRRGFQLQAGQ